MFTRAEIDAKFAALNSDYAAIAAASKYDRGFYERVAKYLYDTLGLIVDYGSYSNEQLSTLLAFVSAQKNDILALKDSFVASAASIAANIQTLRDSAHTASVSAAAASVSAYSAAAASKQAFEGVKAARLEIFDTKKQIEQSALSAAQKLDAVRNEAVAALHLIEQTKDEGVESVNIAKSEAIGEISDKQNIAETTIVAAQNNAILRVEQAKDAGRQSINALTQGITDEFVNLSVTIRNGINTTAADALDDIGTKIDDANDAASLAASKTDVLNATIDTANTALEELHDPQTDIKLLYIDATGALYTAAAMSEYLAATVQRAVASIWSVSASESAAAAEADRVEISGYKADIVTMMGQMTTLLDATKTAEQNAEFIALKEAFD